MRKIRTAIHPEHACRDADYQEQDDSQEVFYETQFLALTIVRPKLAGVGYSKSPAYFYRFTRLHSWP
jgi:hypothetical protein